MIKVTLNNVMMNRLLAIERANEHFGSVRVPVVLAKNGFLSPNITGQRIRSYSVKKWADFDAPN